MRFFAAISFSWQVAVGFNARSLFDVRKRRRARQFFMDTKHYDLIVFGGGNAISTAIYCGSKGMQVALVEKGPLGGTCPHRGCIPSKLLIGYADAAECARAAGRSGFETTVRTPDPDAILRDTFEFTNKYDGILENARHLR